LASVHKVTMSARGQLVIPAEVRRRLGLKGGTRFRVYDSQGKLTLVPEVEDPVHAGLGFLRREQQDSPERTTGLG
jgi:AbrB family looped-hinge helix DNA binding protein